MRYVALIISKVKGTYVDFSIFPTFKGNSVNIKGVTLKLVTQGKSWTASPIKLKPTGKNHNRDQNQPVKVFTGRFDRLGSSIQEKFSHILNFRGRFSIHPESQAGTGPSGGEILARRWQSAKNQKNVSKFTKSIQSYQIDPCEFNHDGCGFDSCSCQTFFPVKNRFFHLKITKPAYLWFTRHFVFSIDLFFSCLFVLLATSTLR